MKPAGSSALRGGPGTRGPFLTLVGYFQERRHSSRSELSPLVTLRDLLFPWSLQRCRPARFGRGPIVQLRIGSERGARGGNVHEAP